MCKGHLRMRNSTLKGSICILFVIVTVFSLCANVCAVDPPALTNARFVYCYCVEKDKMLYQNNEEKPLYPASTAKMMTAILALEYFDDAYDTVITVSEEVVSLSGGTRINYKAGERVTVEQLLYGLIVGNGNDAAYALALAVSGSVDGFVKLMNDKAAALGTENTHFMNPTGVDDSKAYTTAKDVGRIAVYASKMDRYIKISSCEKYEMEPTNMTGERTIANKNYLVSKSYVSTYFLSYATGLNAGSTVKGGNCCVGLATKDGITIVAVVMDVPEKENDKTVYSFYDAKKLIEWAYKSYSYRKVQTKTDIVCEIPVRESSEADYVALLPENDLLIYLPNDADLTKDVRREYELYDEYLTAPVDDGATVGKMTLYYGDECVGEVALVTKNALSRSVGIALTSTLKKLVFNFWTLLIIVLLFVFAAVCILVNAYNRGRRQRRN